MFVCLFVFVFVYLAHDLGVPEVGVVAGEEGEAERGRHVRVALPERERHPVAPFHAAAALLDGTELFCPGVDVRLRPAPEGPVRERDVQVVLGRAVPEQWRRQWRIGAASGAVDGGAVHAVEHEVDVGHAAGVPAHQLEEAPDGEQRPALHARVVEVHVEAAAVAGDGHAHGRPAARGVEELAGDAAMAVAAPGREVAVDRGEVGRALLGAARARRVGW